MIFDLAKHMYEYKNACEARLKQNLWIRNVVGRSIFTDDLQAQEIMKAFAKATLDREYMRVSPKKLVSF